MAEMTVHAMIRNTQPPVVNSVACCSMDGNSRIPIRCGFQGGCAYHMPRPERCQAISVTAARAGNPVALPAYELVLRVSLSRVIFDNL